MTNDAKEAAKKILELSSKTLDIDCDMDGERLLAEEAASLGMVLARAYLAENDDTPLTEDWLRSVGFEADAAGNAILRNDPRTVRRSSINKNAWYANDIRCPECKTCGDVIRLCSALGIPLKPAANEGGEG